MSDRPTILNPVDLLRSLTSLPHRGATTEQGRKAAEILASLLRAWGAQVELQPVLTPPTYLTELWWLLAALILGLLLVPVLPTVSLLWVAIAVGTALAYFDWRETWVSSLPPRAIAQNVLATVPPLGEPTYRLIVMGHYDSAPVSLLYLPSMVTSFRSSLLVSLGLMGLSVFLAFLEVLRVGLPYVAYLRWALILYFFVQGVMSTIDFLRHGYTNGAADNASGTAAAAALAQRLWKDPVPGWRVDLVLTSAEEANMKGALAYFKTRGPFDPRRTFVLNFDNVGSGLLRIVTRTGTLTSVVYDNPLVSSALHVAATVPRFSSVRAVTWRTGDFDTIWFARAGIPSLTVSAQDERGLIPNLHRPSDTLDHVNVQVTELAVDLAEMTARRLAQELGV